MVQGADMYDYEIDSKIELHNVAIIKDHNFYEYFLQVNFQWELMHI